MQNPEQRNSPEYGSNPDTHVPNPEMVEFFESEIYPVLSPLFAGTYSMPEIQQRYNLLKTGIENRYNTNLAVNLSDTESKDNVEGGLLTMGCNLEDNKPSIALFMPALKNFMEVGKNKSTKEQFLITGYLHELEHLASGNIGDKHNVKKTIEAESEAWALTCEHTIKKFVEAGKGVNPSDMLFYNAWKKCGGNPYSKRWRDFISNIYGGLKRHND